MGRFNRAGARPAVSSPVKTESTPATLTGEGGPGYLRNAKSELFLLAITNTVGDDAFYEKARDRDDRYTGLVRRLAVEDPAWTAGMLGWLRSEGHLRSAAIVGAAEYVKGRLDAGEAGDRPVTGTSEDGHPGSSAFTNRRVIDSVLQRPDEPGEMVAYWTGKYGRNIPKPVKRGVADAIARLFDERAAIKYDAGGGYRFGDLLELTHPTARTLAQGDLFAHLIDRRHGRGDTIPASLVTLANRAELLSWPVAERRALFDRDQAALVLKDAGMTWEQIAGWLQGPMNAKVWEALIPSMGLMALTRNLRNFDKAGVSDQAAARIAERLADGEQVRRSRMLPFRFLSAYRAAPSLRWSWPLEQALGHSLANVPSLPGRTLVLVDRSPSMWGQKFSERSSMPWADAAALFGAALALRAAHADLVEFGIENGPVRFGRGESVLKVVERFRRLSGTDVPSAVDAHLRGHDRVVIVTDEQTRPGWLPSNGAEWGGGGPARPIDDLIPASTPLYMWNFGGYRAGAAPSGAGNRHTLGGLSDSAFRLIELLEARRAPAARWPWE
ncbi:TROVE domain-containing protein [Actinomadura roseirufa]|uniref:TROVE domain-containing protein n=1 Tax=Actinomadura roseirufa TaxID=2094049 RepID=UPI00104180D2|nr:TROVE domain-containing protein [Actinomadura roseirufa]